MGTRIHAATGLVGPGIQPLPPSALALDLQKRAASRARADLQEVERVLTSEQDLLRLNTAEEYAQLPAQKLAVQPILARLGRNPAPAAREIIGVLCASKPFLAEESRVECLLQTLPIIHPLPAPALPLLRKSTEPESGSLEIAIRVLFEIGENSTLEIFATEVLNPRQDSELVRSWMRDPLLRHRWDAAVLQMCLGLLQEPKFNAELKNSLVEALFDYRPAEWYMPQDAHGGPPPKPPSPKTPPRSARDLLKKIAAVIAADPAVSSNNKALAEKCVRGI